MNASIMAMQKDNPDRDLNPGLSLEADPDLEVRVSFPGNLADMPICAVKYDVTVYQCKVKLIEKHCPGLNPDDHEIVMMGQTNVVMEDNHLIGQYKTNLVLCHNLAVQPRGAAVPVPQETRTDLGTCIQLKPQP